MKESLEQEINEAVEEEKKHVEEAQKFAEQQKKVNEIKQETTGYKKKESQETKYMSEENQQTEYIENKEFYVKQEKDLDVIKDTIKEITTQGQSRSRVDDSDFYEVEPETKKLKVRKMPRNVLDRLKEKGVILDYYKQL